MSQQHPASLIRHYADSDDPDQRTSMADARIFLCVARGVAMNDIDPASGYDYSRRAYDNTRQSWVSNIKYHGFSEGYQGPALRHAIADWAAHRPDFTAGDDWFAEAEKAHLAYWEQVGIPCNSASCDLHTA